jgi:hypothetical protein
LLVVAVVVQTYLAVAEQAELQDLVAVELEKDLDQAELELLILVVVVAVPNMMLHLVVVELVVQE